MASKKEAPANTAPVEFDPNNPTLDFENWSEEQIGFAPYWSPTEEGMWFVGTPIARDERDPEFVRYLMVAAQETKCHRGPVESAEEVIVKAGETFAVSVYYSLREVFDFYLESGIKPLVRIDAVKKLKTSTPGRTVWQFRARVPEFYKKQLDAARKSAPTAALPAAAQNTRPSLEA